MPLNLKTTLSIFLAAVLFFTVAFSVAQASFLDIIMALVAINPLEVDVTVPAEVEINKTFKVEATVRNKGDDRIENATAQIVLPEGLVLVQKDSVRNMNVIQAKSAKTVSWSVKGESVGEYIISVLASGELRGDIVSADETAKTTLKAKSLPQGRPFHALQLFLETLQRWLQ